jgi:hypothetical protein
MPSDTTPAWLIPGVQCVDPVYKVRFRCTHRQGEFLAFTGFLPGASTWFHGLQRHDSGACSGGEGSALLAGAVANGPDIKDGATELIMLAKSKRIRIVPGDDDGRIDPLPEFMPAPPVSRGMIAEAVKARESARDVAGVHAVTGGSHE